MAGFEGNNWISKLVEKNSSLKINNVYIPGSSSSCSYFTHRVTEILSRVHNERHVKQNISISKQFNEGIRLFDVCVSTIDENFYVVGKEGTDNLKFIAFKDFVAIIIKLMVDNKDESIFLNISLDDDKYKAPIEVFFNGINKKILNTDSDETLEKSTLYISYEKYSDILTLTEEKNGTHEYIDTYIKDNNNPTYMKNKKYTLRLNDTIYKHIYGLSAFLSLLISILLFSVIVWIYLSLNISPKKSEKAITLSFIFFSPFYIFSGLFVLFYSTMYGIVMRMLTGKNTVVSDEFVKFFIFYLFFFNIFLTLLFMFFEKLSVENANSYKHIMPKIIKSLNLNTLTFKKIIYEHCSKEINMQIIAKNFV